MEFEPNVTTKIPFELGLGFDLSLDFGFHSQQILAYRHAQPVRVHQWEYLNKDISDKIIFPTNIKDALKMPIGHEIEICGTGNLGISEGFTLSQGLGRMGIAKAGVAASFEASQSFSNEYSLSIMALDGEKFVRVRISNIKNNNSKIKFQLRTGLLGINKLASTDNSLLKTFLQTASKAELDDFITNYGSLVCSFTNAKNSKDTTVCCYDLDLSKPEAQEAYLCLWRLSPSVVDKLASIPNSGISTVHWREREKKHAQGTHIQLCNKPLLLNEIAEIERNGLIVAPDGLRTIYCEKIFSEKFNNIIYGSREIRWEAIEILDDHNETDNYFRFYFHENSNIPKQEDVDKFFLLAKRLGIKSLVETKSKLIDMTSFEKLTSDLDNTQAIIEVFFTETGVDKLQAADAQAGFLAFHAANDHMQPILFLSEALWLLSEYYKRYEDWWGFLTERSIMKKISQCYEQKFARDFATDYKYYAKAKHFGKLIQKFHNAKNHSHARLFFVSLGKSNCLSYEEILVTLAAIAGREHMLVHKLSMRGGDVAIQSIDEGHIEHPRTQAKNLFSRNIAKQSADCCE
jgi:hypothetical protein